MSSVLCVPGRVAFGKIMLEPAVTVREYEIYGELVKRCVSVGLPVYYSFDDAAVSIDQMLRYNDRYPGKLARVLRGSG